MFGLQVRNGSGNAVLDISDRLTRVLGTVFIQGGPQFSEGSINHGGISSGTFWYALIDNSTGRDYSYIGFSPPKIVQDGNNVFWRMPSGLSKDYVSDNLMIYGVY